MSVVDKKTIDTIEEFVLHTKKEWKKDRIKFIVVYDPSPLEKRSFAPRTRLVEDCTDLELEEFFLLFKLEGFQTHEQAEEKRIQLSLDMAEADLLEHRPIHCNYRNIF